MSLSLQLSTSEIEERCQSFVEQSKRLTPMQIRQHLIKTVLLMDLTSLNADDTRQRIEKLSARAKEPLDKDQVSEANMSTTLQCAAVCTYPLHACVAANCLKGSNVKTATVAGAFPSGLFRLESRCLEVRLAVADGAEEIDIVINRAAAAGGDWATVKREVEAMKLECADKCILKTILATGELHSLEDVYTASITAMEAGSDFIKTSTGKEAVNATLPASYVMIQAIKDYHTKTGRLVGFKVAGGVRHVADVLPYLLMVERELGADFLTPKFCRVGASSLLDDVIKRLVSITTTPL